MTQVKKAPKAQKTEARPTTREFKLADILATLPEPTVEEVVEELYDHIAGFDGIRTPMQIDFETLLSIRRLDAAARLLSK